MTAQIIWDFVLNFIEISLTVSYLKNSLNQPCHVYKIHLYISTIKKAMNNRKIFSPSFFPSHFHPLIFANYSNYFYIKTLFFFWLPCTQSFLVYSFYLWEYIFNNFPPLKAKEKVFPVDKEYRGGNSKTRRLASVIALRCWNCYCVALKFPSRWGDLLQFFSFRLFQYLFFSLYL